MADQVLPAKESRERNCFATYCGLLFVYVLIIEKVKYTKTTTIENM